MTGANVESCPSVAHPARPAGAAYRYRTVHQITEFQFNVLSRVTDDFEAPYTIAEDLERDLGKPVSDAEVLAVLLELAAAGLTFAYQYSDTDQRYVKVEAAQLGSVQDPWFRSRPEIVSQLAPPRT